jgi:hypothetical protein
METTTKTELQEAIEEFVREDSMTGYRLAQLTNEILDSFELKNIPPQMIYNYISKGLIESVVATGQRVVLREAAVEFLTKYVSKKV